MVILIPQSAYGGLSLAIRGHGAIQVGADTRFRAVGHRQTATEHQRGFGSYGCSQRTDRARSSGSVQRTNNPSEFFRTRFELGGTNELRA
jgi:hypothetical protein